MVKKNQGKQTKVKGLLFGLIALLVFTATAGQIDLSKFDPNNLETIVDIFNEPKKTYPSLEALPEFDGSHYVVEINQNKKFEIQEGQDRANTQLNVGEQNSAYIRQISGVTGENRGMDTNATSGIQRRA